MTAVLELIGAKWLGIGVCLGVVATTCLAIIAGGWRFGMRGLEKWVLGVHQPEQLEARRMIRRALDEQADPDKRCDDLLSGFDAWRVSLDRSQRSLAWLRRLQLPLFLLLVASGGALGARYFNPVVAEVLALVAGCLVVWTAIAIAPVCMFVHRNGMPTAASIEAAQQATQTSTSGGPAPPATA